MLNREQAAFLLELLDTPGIAFPIAKCRVASETYEVLEQIAQRVPKNGEMRDLPRRPVE